MLLFLTGSKNSEMTTKIQPNKKVSEKSKCISLGNPSTKLTETKKLPKENKNMPKERKLERKKR